MKKFKLNFICIIFLLLAGSLIRAAADNTKSKKSEAQVNEFNITTKEDVCQIDVNVSKDTNYQVLQLKDENFLVLDILDAVNRLSKSSVNVRNGFIKKVRSSQYKLDPQKIVRIVFELEGVFTYRIENISTGIRLVIEDPVRKLEKEKALIKKEKERKEKEKKAKAREAEARKAEERIAKAKKAETWKEKVRKAKLREAEESKVEIKKVKENEDSKIIDEIIGNEEIYYDSAGLITMGFRDVEINDVLRMFSYSTGINTVVGDEVKGKITMRLVKVPWEQALKAILKTKGYSYIKDQGIIWVSSIEKINKDIQAREKERLSKIEKKPEEKPEKKSEKIKPASPLESKTINLSYADINKVQSSIREILSDRGNILVDTRMNAMIVRDIPENMEKIDEMVSFLDRRTPQVSIESMLIEITTNDTKRLGINWGHPSGSACGIKTINPNGRATIDAGLLPAVAGTSNMTVGTVVDNFALNAAIHAMLSQGTTELLASPKVVTLNDQNATITIGKKIPIRMLDSDGFPVTQLISIGIKLDVKPHITADGHILMQIRPEVSYVEPKPVSGGDIEINTTEAQTLVMVKDSQTAVIGGLIRKDLSQTEDKVPFLGNIPILGFFFKGKSNSDSRKELLIFVTPHIVTDEELSSEAVLGLKRMEEVSLDKKEQDTTKVIKRKKKSNSKKK